MNFKSLKVVLITLAFGLTAQAFAEKMPESPKQKEVRLENDLNDIFKRGLDVAAYKLNEKQDIRPFAIIKKVDGRIGLFELDITPETEKMSVNQMTFSVRRYLTELAIAKQIKASALVMHATVQQKGKGSTQGLSFEIEHLEGVSLLRFLPITKHTDKDGPAKGKTVLHTEAMTATIKPVTVFTEMVKAIAANKAAEK